MSCLRAKDHICQFISTFGRKSNVNIHLDPITDRQYFVQKYFEIPWLIKCMMNFINMATTNVYITQQYNALPLEDLAKNEDTRIPESTPSACYVTVISLQRILEIPFTQVCCWVDTYHDCDHFRNIRTQTSGISPASMTPWQTNIFLTSRTIKRWL